MRKYILNSKAYAANKEFEKAVREILKVDPSSNCSAKQEKNLRQFQKIMTFKQINCTQPINRLVVKNSNIETL